MNNHDNYYQCVRGLIKLHGLDLLGMNDSAEAEEIRDGLVDVYYLLPEDQINELRILSEMLYEASDRYKGNNLIP